MPCLRAGLIGAHISRTRLPAALEILCAHAGWTLEFTLIDTADLRDFDFAARVARAREEGWTGVTVTHPWKTRARALAGADMQTDVAHLGACNTLTFSHQAQGHNTDYSGFLAAFRAFGRAPGRVVLMGAGGVAEALAPALMELGASDLAICDINQPRAQALAVSCGGRVLDPTTPDADVLDADGLINATPLGMLEYPGTPFDPALLGAQRWAFDAVYTPTHTLFLRDAALAGLACLSGFDLFRAMALRSFHAYTGLDLTDATIGAELDALRPD